MSRSTLVLASILALAGCSDDQTGNPSLDSGGARDAAVGRDAATTVDDTGVPMDDAAMIVDDTGSSGCGTCPSGTSCGSANGIPVCRDDATGIPRFTSVFVIVMENMSLSTVMAATNTPFLSGLFSDHASGSDYHGVDHPSLPNYLGMTSGMVTTSIGCDCHPTGSACSALTCSTLVSSCGCPQDVMHIGDQLEAAGIAWHDYGEDMGAPCNTTDSGSYVARHNPFLYYDNVRTDAARCAAHVVDYGSFSPDADPHAFSFIAPNLVHDMHDPFITPVVGDPSTNLANGDAWLSANVPPILASTAYTSGGLLVVVWDEDDYSGGITNTNDPIAILVMSPYAKSGGYVSTVTANHYALLATIQDGFGLPRLGQSVGVAPLRDFFPDL